MRADFITKTSNNSCIILNSFQWSRWSLKCLLERVVLKFRCRVRWLGFLHLVWFVSPRPRRWWQLWRTSPNLYAPTSSLWTLFLCWVGSKIWSTQVYTGLHVYHVSKSNAFTTSSHIQGRSLAILGNIHCQLSMVRIKAVYSSLQFAWCFLWWRGALQSGRRRDQRCFWPSSWCLRQCAGGLDLSHAARGVPFL